MLGLEDLTNFTVAEKMSWATGRDTTRVEDRAYSLLGIFDINMPLLYGEGHKAFQRLQCQIIETTEDYTIFAWEEKWEVRESRPETASFLAVTPSNFMSKGDAGWTYGDLEAMPEYQKDWNRRELKREGLIPPRVTSRGVWMPLPIAEGKTWKVALLSRIPNMGSTLWLGIEVQPWSAQGDSGPEWIRHVFSRKGDGPVVIDVKNLAVDVRLIYGHTRDQYI